MFLFAAALTTCTVAAQDAHAGHDHGSTKAWEWAGVFDFTAYSSATTLFSVNKAGKYADDSIDVLLLRTTSADAAGIESVEDSAAHLFENTSAFISVTQSNAIVTPGTVHKLKFDSKNPVTTFRLTGFEEDANNKAAYVIFAQHFPSEFENLAGHFLKSMKGEDIEAAATEPAAVVATVPQAGASEHADQAIGASIIVTMLGAIGLFIVYPCWNGLGKNKTCITWTNDIAQTFAAGALLSTSFFLIFPEALHHLKKAHPTDDVLQIVAFGGTTLTGVVLSMMISMICTLFGTPSAKDLNVTKQTIAMTDIGKKDDIENGDDKNENQLSLSTKNFCQCRPSEWTGAAWTVLVGDFFHNVADGIAIGVAFRTCDPAFGWVVAIGAIGHEVSQEVADFCLLITRGNMSVGAAVLANLLSGVSCIIGAVVASYVDMSEEAVGGLLAFSGGVYLWAAMCECLSPLVEETKSMKAILLRVTMFSVGAVCIGLVLLNHVHCEAGLPPAKPGEDPHAGHNH